MRVLHVTAGKLYGGIESYLVTLARYRHLAPEMEPSFALCFAGRLSEELGQAGARVSLLGEARFSRPWTVWRARRQFARVLDQEGPRVVVCHECWPHALFASVVRRRGLSLVFAAHGLHEGGHWLERWARRHPPRLAVANSRQTQTSLTGLFRGVPRAVVYPPVPAPMLADRGATRARLRAALGAAPEAVVILQAARLEPGKGQELLLQALGLLGDLPGWVCWLAGGAQRPQEHAYLDGLRRKAGGLGLAQRVRFLGQRRDVHELMAAADLHCQPNLSPEAFGVAFVEAAHAGLPVVTTALGAALDVVGAESGVLVPPADKVALAGVLRRLVGDEALRRQLGSNGPARAAELCDPGKRLRQWHDLLEPLCRGRKELAG
jgi:glycosyltransferase involved in cell wall biosynthesis